MLAIVLLILLLTSTYVKSVSPCNYCLILLSSALRKRDEGSIPFTRSTHFSFIYGHILHIGTEW